MGAENASARGSTGIAVVSRAAPSAPAPTTGSVGLGEGTNLRLLLELRRRLKSAAERELALGRERIRLLRGELRHGQAELRVWERMLECRAQELAREAARVAAASRRAAETCNRLGSLERENEDLTRQLRRAEEAAIAVRAAVPVERHPGSSILASFVAATQALVRELGHAARDQSALRARARDLLEEGEILAAEAEALAACFASVEETVKALRRRIAESVDGASPPQEAPASEVPAEEGASGPPQESIAGAPRP